MAAKRISVNLNKQERMLINDVCMLVGQPDRSKVIRSLAVTKAHEFLKQITEQRQKQREEALDAAKEQASEGSGDASSDTEEALDSSSSDSDVVASEKDSMVEAGGSEAAPSEG